MCLNSLPWSDRCLQVNIGKLHPKSRQGWSWRSEQRPVAPCSWGRAVSSNSWGAPPPSPQGSFNDRESAVCSNIPMHLRESFLHKARGEVCPESLVHWPLFLILAHFLINYIYNLSVALEQVDFRRKCTNFPACLQTTFPSSSYSLIF